ncbi:DUF3892 domain-containing protein [Mycobacterium sp.]|uniref:DUF3892 domain-containing protein n=1 Tax=Mycobacterium sp. TaxID=1785 RepID=UPI0039C994F5
MWWIDEAHVIADLQAGRNTFFVQAPDGSHSEVVVGNAPPIDRLYLRTTPDSSKEANLSTLPPFGPTDFRRP